MPVKRRAVRRTKRRTVTRRGTTRSGVKKYIGYRASRKVKCPKTGRKRTLYRKVLKKTKPVRSSKCCYVPYKRIDGVQYYVRKISKRKKTVTHRRRRAAATTRRRVRFGCPGSYGFGRAAQSMTGFGRYLGFGQHGRPTRLSDIASPYILSAPSKAAFGYGYDDEVGFGRYKRRRRTTTTCAKRRRSRKPRSRFGFY